MDNLYAVRTLKLSWGERLPVLRDTRVGMPLFAPTVYSLTQLRGRNLASGTIEQSLRHLMVLLLFLEQSGIDLDARVHEGRVLDLDEVEALTKLCSYPLECIVANWGQEKAAAKLGRQKSRERLRQLHPSAAPRHMNPDSTADRIRVIADYLSWFVRKRALTLSASSPGCLALESVRQQVEQALLARVPRARGRNIVDAREGLSQEVADRLLAVTAKNSLENPWRSNFTRTRNELVIRWLYSFGLRRGELLNVKISDIDFRAETITIVRRPDAPEDPRTEQPKVKTRDRVLPIPTDLCRLTHDYVLHARRHLRGARRHEYLFVADKTGAPLSLSALNKCFVVLRTMVPDMPDDLVPHVLRHTWNDNFSEVMDREKTPEADEQKMRSFLMGWSDVSGTAATYTRRHVRRKANAASLRMQAEMTRKAGKS